MRALGARPRAPRRRPAAAAPPRRLLSPKRTNLRIRLGPAKLPPGPSTDLLLDFLAAVLSVDPDRRPTAAQALRHPWLAEMEEFDAYALPQ